MTDNQLHNPHKEFLDLLVMGNRIGCSEFVLKQLDNNVSIKSIYEDIIKNALYEVGELWEYNKISVATEHLASAIVETIINVLYYRVISHEKNNKKIVVACVENEFHQIGIKMVSDMFEMHGWTTNFLGANTPTHELINFTRTTKPDLLALSLSIYFHVPILEKMLQTIRKEFPDLPILVGGQAFRNGAKEVLLKYDNVTYLPDLHSVEIFIKNLNEHG